MLTKEQLQAIAHCSELVGCEDCPKKNELIDTDCTDEAAKTALELMDEVDRLRKCYEVTNKSWVGLATENTSLKQEIERLREIIFAR
jgi:hypothetical protein